MKITYSRSFAVAGLLFLAVVAASPLGVINAYPDPPSAALNGPMARERAVNAVELSQMEGEPADAYLKRITMAVHDGMTHFWYSDQRARKYTRVSFFDNWIMWGLSHTKRFGVFADYEFSSPRKALARGYGYCSQVTYILYSVLRDQGFDPTILMHPNHVVLEVNGTILDADYGVVIPHSASELASKPGIIAAAYPGHPLMPSIYADGWRRRTDHEAFDHYRALEFWLDILKWAPGVALFGLAFAVRERRACKSFGDCQTRPKRMARVSIPPDHPETAPTTQP